MTARIASRKYRDRTRKGTAMSYRAYRHYRTKVSRART
jgi:hypothetical protein